MEVREDNQMEDEVVQDEMEHMQDMDNDQLVAEMDGYGDEEAIYAMEDEEQ